MIEVAVSARRASMPRLVPAGVVQRALHPLAWWVWALSLAVATTRTANPVLIALIVAAVVVVVFCCRDDSPWAHAFPAYLVFFANAQLSTR